MRIIAGKAKGFKLSTPKDLPIRPTSDRVREALFNILAPRIAGSRFLDLFAGTGANGIEALSRGAAQATFVDSDGRALQVVTENLDRCRLHREAVTCKGRIPDDLGLVNGPFDIVFADPPYAFEGHEGLLDALGTHRLVAHGGIVIIEHGKRATMPETPGPFQHIRRNRYGDTLLSFYA